jgi:TatA/E family protein of Tat protein translocase
MSIGPAEIIIVLILALLVFGPKRLPQMGRSLGKGVREFRKAADTAKQEFGLGEVTDTIKDVKQSVAEPFKEVKSTVTEPFKEVKDTVGDLKQAVDVKAAIEAPVTTAAAAGAAGAAASTAGETSDATSTGAPAAEAPAVVDAGPMVTPEAAPVNVATRDQGNAPEPPAPEAPDEVAAGSPASPASGA